jgi:uncharacterized protein (TIGR02246 family)
MRWKSIVPFALLALVLPGGLAAAQDNTARDLKREADRLAIDKLTRDLIQAFEKRDAAAIAANWTEDGEFTHNDDEPVHGRDAIQKGYAEFFKTLKGKPKVEIQADAPRFPSADTAIVQAAVRLKNDEGETVASGRQDTLLVREGGRWKLAVVREWDRDTATDVNLKDLEWLVGTWRAATKEREVTLTYEWDENKAFIRGKFAVKEGGKAVESGVQMIGKDNAEGVLRWWLFQSDGGVGSGAWTRDGKKWSVDVHGVGADGKRLTATTIFIPVDADTLTWQAVNQTLNGVAVPDTPPIKVTRQKPAK